MNFVEVKDENNLKVLTYERGCGITLACGTGVCASVLTSYKLGKCSNHVDVHLEKGIIHIDIDEDERVYMTGPAECVMKGYIIMIKGSIVALITPFNEDGSVNFDKLGELLEMHVENGTDGILVLGTTGESSTMSHEEDDAVVEYTIKKINHRLPVVVGAGSNSTQTAIEKSIKYDQMGADYLLIITPYYNKANEQGMIAHFTSVADAVSIPVIMYNVPGRTGCKLSESAVKVLSQHPNICGIKEASGDISYVMNISRYLNDDFVMYSGNDDMVVPVLSAGGQGVISVC